MTAVRRKPRVPEIVYEGKPPEEHIEWLEPILDGLGEALLTTVEHPEAVCKPAVQAEYHEWKIRDDIVAEIYRPPTANQTCFVVVSKYAQSSDVLRDFYQLEYFDVPRLVRKSMDIGDGEQTWVATEINNSQLLDWFDSVGFLAHSEEIIEDAVKDREIKYRFNHAQRDE